MPTVFRHLVSAAGIVILADLEHTGAWAVVFWVTGLFMLVGIGTTLTIEEVSDDALAPHSLRDAVINPFVEFFSRDARVLAARDALAILAFLVSLQAGGQHGRSAGHAVLHRYGLQPERDRFRRQGARA